MDVFYRKYRPQDFSDLAGQTKISQILLSQLQSGKISHGYLFSGPRGIGKTTTARIFAKSVNCEKSEDNVFGEPCNKCQSCVSITNGSSLDVIEIDAASNRLIDDIRDLREKVKLSPVSLRYKVYIIDEVHMLTREAFNALLKTLEEPPKHAIFILCTTEVNKIPHTILSRVQRFSFERASFDATKKVLEKIIKKEGLTLNSEAVDAIVKSSEGSFRDAVSILDQVSAKKEFTADEINKLIKSSSWNNNVSFIENVVKNNLKEAVLYIEELVSAGGEINFFIKETLLILEKILFEKIGIVENDLDPSQNEDLKRISNLISYHDLQNLIRLFLVAEGEIKIYPQAQIPVVLAICKFCKEPNIEENNTLGEQHTVPVEADKPVEIKNTKKVIEKNLNLEKKTETVVLGKGNLLAVESKWIEFLNKVKIQNAHLFALLKSTRPVSYAKSTIVLEVFYAFHKEKLSEIKIMDLLCSILSELLDDKIRINLVLAKRDTKPTKTVLASNVVGASQEDLGNIALEIFSE